MTTPSSRNMEGAGYHYSSVKGRIVWGHSLVTTHYTNRDVGYPVDLALYLKRETCLRESLRFKTKIQLACDQVKAFTPPRGTGNVVVFDSWYFCHKLVEASSPIVDFHLSHDSISKTFFV